MRCGWNWRARSFDNVDVPADDTRLQRVYVIAPNGSEAAQSDRIEIRFWVEDLLSGDRVHKDSAFNGAAQ